MQYAPTSVGIAPDVVVTDDRIPGVRQVVKSLTLDDGRGGVAETTFRFDGGRWSEEHRESFGFTTVKETLPRQLGDGGDLVRTATFDTVNYASAGQILSETLEFDPDDNSTNTILSRSLNSWIGTGTGMGPFAATLSSTRSAIWRGDAPTALIETRKDFTFTPYGEVASTTDLGFVASGNGSDYTSTDNTVSITEYSLNLAGYIVSKPSHTRVEKVDSALSGRALWLRADFFQYDGQAQGASPTKGNLTGQAVWTGSLSASAPPRNVKAMTYDGWGNVTQELDANNLALAAGLQLPTTHTYGGTGTIFRLTTRSPINQDAGFTPDETLVWNEKCQAPQSVADQNNQITLYLYDELCREIQKTLPGGAYQKTEYLGLGLASLQRIRSLTKSPAGPGIDATRTVFFDGLGRVYRSDVPGNLTSATDATSSVAVLKSYSPRGNITWQSIPLASGAVAGFAPTLLNATFLTYDFLGRPSVIMMSGERKQQTEYGFKWLTVGGVSVPHPLTKTRDPNCFDAAAPATVCLKSGAVADGRGNRVALIRYGANSQIGSDDPTAENLTEFGYDLLGQLTSVVDPMEIGFAYTYDVYGNRTQANDPGLGIWTMTYDRNGNLLTQTDQAGNVISFLYDDLDRVTRKEVTTAAGQKTRTLSTWGPAGNFNTTPGTSAGRLLSIKVSNPAAGSPFTYDHTITYTYTATGLVQSFNHVLKTPDFTMTLPFTNVYGADNATLIRQDTPQRTTAISAGTPNPPWQSWQGPTASYDVAGRLVGLTKGTGAADVLISSVTYDIWSNPQQVIYGNGARDTTATDPVRGWIDATTAYEAPASGTGPGPLLVTSVLTRQPNSKIAAVAGGEASASLTYSYDWFGRLKTLAHPLPPSGPAPDLTQSFTYDAADRITNNSLLAGSGGYDYHLTPTSGRPQHAPLMVNGATLTYDANGNQTKGLRGQVIRYDGENRPVSVILSGTETCYGYGADGSRIARKTYTNSNTGSPPASVCPTDMRGLFTGQDATLFIGPLEIERPGQIDETLHVFAHPNIRMTLATPGSPARTHSTLHRDVQGSVRAVTAGQDDAVTPGNERGREVERRVYRPYGEQIPMLALAGTPVSKGWIGERFDAEAGLQYLNARYFDPDLAMFIQPDWWEVTEPGVGTNRYAYAGGDPVNGVDPSGHCYNPGPFGAILNCSSGGGWSGLGWDILAGAVNAPTNFANAGLNTVSSIGGAMAPIDGPLMNWAMTTQGHPATTVDDIAAYALHGLVASNRASKVLAAKNAATAFGRTSRLTGTISKVNESMSNAARGYQARVTGMEAGTVYRQNGVNFDGYDAAAGLLIDAKYGMDFMVKGSGFKDWARLPDKLAAQAGRQIAAADGASIEWRFSSQSVANAVRNFFVESNINISVVYIP